MEFGNRIQKLRKKQGLSQEDLAFQLNVSRQAISKWESNQSLPDIDKIIMLSNIFKVSCDYLLKGIEDAKTVNYKMLSQGLIISLTFLFGVIAYGLNRFRNAEILFISIGGGLIGYGISSAIKAFHRK